MAARNRRPRNSTRSKRRKPRTVRPVEPTSPKGKVALLMMKGRHTYTAIAKKIRRTLNNIYQHATHLRGRGSKISVKDGIVRLLATARKVFASWSARCFGGASPYQPARFLECSRNRVGLVDSREVDCD